MTGSVYRYLADDHRRLEQLLDRASQDPSHIDASAYFEFRGGLLRHISMEEKILLPAARAALGGTPLPLAAALRLDHGALAALLVLTPTLTIIKAIRTILAAHNAKEEGADGIYSQCENLPGFNSDEILSRLQKAPAVAMAEYVDSPLALASACNAIDRAGYDSGMLNGL
jgi:Hemerythrin HHE cation binding domain